MSMAWGTVIGHMEATARSTSNASKRLALASLIGRWKSSWFILMRMSQECPVQASRTKCYAAAIVKK